MSSIIKRLFLILVCIFIFTSVLQAHEHHKHAAQNAVVTHDVTAEDVKSEHPLPIKSILGLHAIEGVGQNIHPVIVHFPIALLVVSFLFYGFGLLFRKESLLQAGKWTLFFGTISTLAAVVTGIVAGNIVDHDEVVHQIMEWHEYLGFAVLGISIFLSAWLLLAKTALPIKGKWVFIAILTALVLLLVQQADLGGQMVFLHGTGVRGAPDGTTHSLNDHQHHSHDDHE